MRFLELRIPPPLVGLVIAAGMWGVARVSASPALQGVARLPVALTLAAIGVAISIGGVASFRRARTTVNPLKPETSAVLVSTGIYSVTRNPMYLGLLLVLFGWAAYLASYWSLLGPLAFATFITRFQILPEERTLERLFGAPFTEYKQRVRRWLCLPLALCLVAASCAAPVPPDRVTGTYRGQFEQGSEVLVLQEGGRYEETFTFPDGRAIMNEGTWTQDQAVKPRRVSLSMAIVHPKSDAVERVDWEFVPAVVDNGVELRAKTGRTVLLRE